MGNGFVKIVSPEIAVAQDLFHIALGGLGKRLKRAIRFLTSPEFSQDSAEPQPSLTRVGRMLQGSLIRLLGLHVVTLAFKGSGGRQSILPAEGQHSPCQQSRETKSSSSCRNWVSHEVRSENLPPLEG
jgi:hypothetical protein